YAAGQRGPAQRKCPPCGRSLQRRARNRVDPERRPSLTRAVGMAVPPVDRLTFPANRRQGGLLPREPLPRGGNRPPDTERGRPVARALVEQGLLTKFQAERLLAGLTNGFVLGQYLILDQLGQGGMGRVYKAQHRTMHRVVALKVLGPNLLKTGK